MNSRSQRLGFWLFGAYLVLYVSYVLVMAFDADQLKVIGPGGINLAVSVGFGLIIAAFLLALLYGWLCGRDEASGHEGLDLRQEKDRDSTGDAP